MAILVVVALVVLGPERLPGAMSWVAKSLKQARDYATGAQNQLKDELGPEFEDFKKPLSELRELRGMTPRGIITKHLLDGDESIFTGNFGQQTPPGQRPGASQQPSPPPASPAASPPAAGASEGPGPGAAVRYDEEAT